MYRNREEAGMELAHVLTKYKGKNGVVLAIPRGGIPVASVIAEELNLPLDLALVKKIGHPMNKEYAIGAISIDDEMMEDVSDVSEDYIVTETDLIKKELRRRRILYMGDRQMINLRGKIVIIVDDGIATGFTMLSTIKLVQKNSPKRIVIASPVASREAVYKIVHEADELIIPMIPEEFNSVGHFYADFHQVSDKEVIDILNNKNSRSRLRKNKV